MDGVLFRGQTALPQAAVFLRWLRDRQIGFVLTTNNSTLTPAQNAQKLKSMGLDVPAESILTSSLATATYLVEQGAEGHLAIAIGETGLTEALTSAGIRLTDDPASARWVIAGLDRQVTYEKLRLACLAIETGATFVATNADSSLPVEEGLIPGAGAIQAAIIATTGVKPVVIGKPEPPMLTEATRIIDADPKSTAVLGDRLDTDIAAAHRAGLSSILVLTGVSTEEDLQGSTIQPTVVFKNLPELMERWPA